MKKVLFVGLVLLALAVAPSGYAQKEAALPVQQEEISVVAFKRLPNDITARVTAPKRDQNNEPCAIIKVVSRDKGLFFEPDALGIVAREDQPGEIWLYVPHGSKRITIKHERFGIIRNYFYNEPIDKATVYELVLHVPQVKAETVIIHQEVTEQTLMMNYSPSNAQIYIDDKLQTTDNNGAFSTILPIGSHRYNIVAPHHDAAKGSFDIVPERLTALNVALQPKYAFLAVASNMTETKVNINGEYVGRAPYSSDTISAGKYRVDVTRKWYIPQTQEVEIKPTETKNVSFLLKRQAPNLFLIGQLGNAMGKFRQTSFGLMAGICRKGGGYISVRTNGSPEFTDGTNYMSNPYGLYTGVVKKHHFSAAAGFMVCLMKYAYFYAGGGYLWRTMDWEVAPEVPDVAEKGRYQHIQRTAGGVLDIGLIGRYKCFALSVGATCDFNNTDIGAYQEFTVGIGYVFGR